MSQQNDLDDYLNAIASLKQRMEDYGTVASALQNAASILLKSHQTSESSARLLKDLKSEIETALGQFVSDASMGLKDAASESDRNLKQYIADAQLHLAELGSRADESFEALQRLDPNRLSETIAARYAEHQQRLDQMEKSIRDAVDEQRRLGLQSLQQTTSFQTELRSFSDLFGRFAEQARSENLETINLLQAGVRSTEQAVGMSREALIQESGTVRSRLEIIEKRTNVVMAIAVIAAVIGVLNLVM